VLKKELKYQKTENYADAKWAKVILELKSPVNKPAVKEGGCL